MEGDEGVACGESAVGGDFRRSADKAERGDGREDGNLIRGEGIFLGKGRDGRSKWRSMLDVDSGPNTNLEVEL